MVKVPVSVWVAGQAALDGVPIPLLLQLGTSSLCHADASLQLLTHCVYAVFLVTHQMLPSILRHLFLLHQNLLAGVSLLAVIRKASSILGATRVLNSSSRWVHSPWVLGIA